MVPATESLGFLVWAFTFLGLYAFSASTRERSEIRRALLCALAATFLFLAFNV